jgi:RNA polymerase primary sigma factor
MNQLKISQCVTARTMTVDNYLRDVNRLPMVSPEEEAELAGRIQEGDVEAYRRLVEANLKFVISVAKAYQGSGMDLCDLINEGNIGLMKAAEKFDPTRGFKFISYAVWWIRQQILSSISEHGRMVRLPLNQMGAISRINRARARFQQENEREPTDEELAEFLDLTPDKIAEALANSPHHVSFDLPFDDESDGTLLDVVSDTGTEKTDAALESESLHEDLTAAMGVLNGRERSIVTMAFGIRCREMSLEEIAQQLELTRERVRQLKEKAIRKLARPEIRKNLVQYR